MLVQELSCLEVLLNYLINDSNLNKEIFTDFTSTLTFDSKRRNLFNIMSIRNLLNNYTENANFSLSEFIKDGTIKGLFEKRTTTPAIDPKYVRNYRAFIDNVVDALREENYVFDDDNNIFISSEKVETTVPQAWLYRLSEGYKRSKFSKFYFYNKTKEADISDKNSLIDYLRFTKTFLVTLSSQEKSDFEIEFAKAESITNNEIKNEPVVKVEKLIEIFKKNISPKYEVEIGRYKLTDLFFIVAKAEEAGKEFYTKPLEEQKKDINDWLIDFVNSNKKANETAQEYLLIGEEVEDKKEKKEVIIGLINLYLTVLSTMEIDFNEVSLTDIKITNYIPVELQKQLEERKKLTKALNNLVDNKHQIKQKIDSLLPNKNDKEATLEISELIKAYRAMEERETYYQVNINTLQDSIRNNQKDSLLDISFANNEIIKLLIETTRNGRIYMKDNHIVFELYNNQIGQTTFKASITTQNLLTLIENINYILKQGYRNTRI